MHRYFYLSILLFSLIFMTCSGNGGSNDKEDDNNPDPEDVFLNGVDTNYYLSNYSAENFTEDGQIIPSDDLPYLYFKDKGINAARIRVWVGNDAAGNYENALANGLAAKDAGLQTLLTIMYSDEFSDNISCDSAKVGDQFEGLSFEEKKTAVADYTTDLIQDFKSDGLSFDLYAVGNEVLNCFVGESDKGNMAELMEAAYGAIEALDPDARFILHTAHGSNTMIKDFFADMIGIHKLSCDYVSTSFYPLQYGGDTFEDLKDLASDLYSLYDKPFIVSEWAYSDQELPEDSIWITMGVFSNTPVTGYPLTPRGQYDLIEDLIQWGQDTSYVAGVYYWEPMHNIVYPDGESVWVWLALFDENNEAKSAIDALQPQ